MIVSKVLFFINNSNNLILCLYFKHGPLLWIHLVGGRHGPRHSKDLLGTQMAVQSPLIKNFFQFLKENQKYLDNLNCDENFNFVKKLFLRNFPFCSKAWFYLHHPGLSCNILRNIPLLNRKKTTFLQFCTKLFYYKMMFHIILMNLLIGEHSSFSNYWK